MKICREDGHSHDCTKEPYLCHKPEAKCAHVMNGRGGVCEFPSEHPVHSMTGEWFASQKHPFAPPPPAQACTPLCSRIGEEIYRHDPICPNFPAPPPQAQEIRCIAHGIFFPCVECNESASPGVAPYREVPAPVKAQGAEERWTLGVPNVSLPEQGNPTHLHWIEPEPPCKNRCAQIEVVPASLLAAEREKAERAETRLQMRFEYEERHKYRDRAHAAEEKIEALEAKLADQESKLKQEFHEAWLLRQSEAEAKLAAATKRMAQAMDDQADTFRQNEAMKALIENHENVYCEIRERGRGECPFCDFLREGGKK